MASTLPRRDVSLSWPICPRPACTTRHLPEFDCPPRGRWLVARGCPACNGSTYCSRHGLYEYGRPVLTLVR